MKKQNNISRADDGLDWTPLRVCGSEGQEYVEYYVRNPLTNTMCRRRHKFNRFGAGQERAKMIQQFIRNTEAKLANGWNPYVNGESDIKTNATLVEVQNDYLQMLPIDGKRERTIGDYENRLKHFCVWAKAHNIRMIGQCTTAIVEDYLHYRVVYKHISNKTFNNERTFLSAFFGWCVRRFYLKDNPCKDIQTKKEEERQLQILTDGEMKRIVEYLDKKDRWFLLAVMMQYYTLIRPNELLNLRLRDIHLAEQYILVPAEISKNHRSQRVALPTRLVRFMIELHLEVYSAEKYLFGYGCVPNEVQGNHALLRYRWRKLREELHLPFSRKFYSLKSNGIIDLINEEGVLVARDQARHSNINITNRYAQFGQNYVHEEVKRFRGKL